MDRKKVNKGRRRMRCSTEPPLTLVCSQTPGTDQPASPDLLNVSWTWDPRGVRRSKTLKRHPTFKVSLLKRQPTYRKPPRRNESIASRVRCAHGSMDSSSHSSEYFDAPQGELDDAWNIDLEHYSDAFDDIEHVYEFEKKRYETITHDYAHLYDTKSRSQYESPKVTAYNNGFSFSKAKFEIGDSGCDDFLVLQNETSTKRLQQPQRELKRKGGPTSYIDIVAKTIKWTMRKSDLLFPRSEKRDSYDCGRLPKGTSQTLPRGNCTAPAQASTMYNTLPYPKVADENDKSKAEVKLESKLKKIWRKVINGRRKSSDPPKVLGPSGLSNQELDNVLSILGKENPNIQLTGSELVRASGSMTRSCGGQSINSMKFRQGRANGWCNKYKKTTAWSNTAWEYSAPDPTKPPSSPTEKVLPTPETAVFYLDRLENDPVKSDSTALQVNPLDSVPNSHGQITHEDTGCHRSRTQSDTAAYKPLGTPQLRDKVEFFDIRALTDSSCERINGSNASLSELPVSKIDLTRPDSFIEESLVKSIEETLLKSDESVGLTVPRTKAAAPASPLFKRLLSTIKEGTTSRGSLSGGSDDSHSAVHSSDADEDGERPDSASLLDRFRGLRKDMQKKISKVKSPRGAPGAGGLVDGDYSTPVNDGRGLRSPPALDTTTLSNRSSSSGGLPSPNAPPPPAPYTGPFIGRAVALVDFQSAYDDDLLKFKKGDVIDIISKNPTGHWKGCLNGRVGEFKFILVEEQRERGRRRGGTGGTAQLCPYPSLEALLKQLQLGHLLQVFMLNGYENLDQFREVEERDLDSLGIKDPDIRKRLMTAAASIPEAAPAGAADTNNASSSYRDSGCFTDQRIPANLAPESDENNADGRQSSPSTDNSSGYQSRGNYSLPNAGDVSSTLQEVPDNTLDSSSSTEDASATHRGQPKDKNVPGSSKVEDDAPLGPDSYHATQVLVRPGTPDPEDTGELEPLELRNKSVGYKNSDVDLEPVSPRCSSDTGVFVQSEGDSVTEEPPGSDQG